MQDNCRDIGTAADLFSLQENIFYPYGCKNAKRVKKCALKSLFVDGIFLIRYIIDD